MANDDLADDLAAVLRSLKASIDAQAAFAEQVQVTASGAVRMMADLLRGQLGDEA